jgi:hypothetical protein
VAADTRLARQVDAEWPLVFIGKVRPHGRRGQRCKRIRREPGGVTLVRFQKDGRDAYVLNRKLVRRDEY